MCFDTIIPFVRQDWEDEQSRCGADYDAKYSLLAERAAKVRHQLGLCQNPALYDEFETELMELEHELCRLSQLFDAPADEE